MYISAQIPDGADVLVKTGDFVEIGDVLFSLHKSIESKINIADELKIKPKEIFKYLQKLIGEKIEKEETIAKKKGLFKEKTVISPFNGTIKSIDHISGDIIIVTRDRSQNKNLPGVTSKSFFTGKIKAVETGFLQVELEKPQNFEIREISGDGGGEIFCFSDESLYFSANENQIGGRIVVIEELKPHIQVKCEALGARGFVVIRGVQNSELPTVVLSRKSDYDKIIELKKKHLVFTTFDRVCCLYN